MDYEPILTQNVHKENSRSIATYEQSGGYSALRKVFKEMSPAEVVDEVKASNLRGRGGAGFPTGVKWSFVPKNTGKPTYLIMNADESEPGTFKDRLLMSKDPHMVVEGQIISSFAIGCELSFIYIRGEFYEEAQILEAAIEEAREKGYLGKNILGSGFNHDIIVHRGAGAYICGEETGLIESLEGKRGWPRIKPPFPAVEGYLQSPTIVNNVETLANVPHIITRGAEWFKNIGPEKSPGPKLYCLSGDVENPGVYEHAMGYPLKDLIYKDGGGIWKGRELKAVIPGGSSVPVLTADEIDINMDFDSVAAAGSMLGSAATMVIDDTACMVDALSNLTKFYAHESCGQCTPCREGSPWMMRIVRRIENGDGEPNDLDMLLDIGTAIQQKTICPFGDAAMTPVTTFVQKFRDEFEYHIEHKKCMVSRQKLMPQVA